MLTLSQKVAEALVTFITELNTRPRYIIAKVRQQWPHHIMTLIVI